MNLKTPYLKTESIEQNMFAVFVLIAVMTSVVSTDFCHFVKPNDEYIGIGLYRQFVSLTKDKYLVFSPNSTEMWELFIVENSNGDIEVNIGNKSNEVNELGVTHRFIIKTNSKFWMYWVKNMVRLLICHNNRTNNMCLKT